MFMLRFDLRGPDYEPGARSELYGSALEMAAWSEGHGCLGVTISEHHAARDGYLPSPLVVAAAMAARTTTLAIRIAALLLPLYEPVRLAEEMAVLDLVSKGRVSYVIGLGYRPEEFAMFGQELSKRGDTAERYLSFLCQAFTGEPFEFEGRPVHVLPAPYTPGGPDLAYGGGSPAAARRAARHGMDFVAQSCDPSLEVAYRDEAERLSLEAGACLIPPEGFAGCVFVSEDPERTWAQVGQAMLHDATTYARWEGFDPRSATTSRATTVDELRAEQGTYRVMTPDEAVQFIRSFGALVVHPLCGGAPAEAGWETLELLSTKVLPAV
jgi:alkanesulfonate monooxygenase SsuD/methylene tetrahydromethanopterin reductase-like flavin-dependent oxidoreductase (luciferase family)